MKAIKLGPQTRAYALDVVSQAPDGHVMRVSEPTRNLDQNAAMWPLLEAYSDQLEWPVNGEKVKLSTEEWKDILTAAFHDEVSRVALGFNGGMVLLGHKTSKFTVQQFSEFLDFIQAAGVERGVKFERRPPESLAP